MRRSVELADQMSAGAWMHVKGEVFNNYAERLRERGRYEEALSYYDRALAVAEEYLGAEHPNVTHFLNNRGGALSEVGRHDEARRDLERARATVAAQPKPHFEPALLDYNLAALDLSQGNFARARERLESAHAGWLQRIGPDHPFTAATEMSLGTLARLEGEFPMAIELGEQARTKMHAAFPGPHYLMAMSDAELSLSLAEAGRIDDARKLATEAIAGFEAAGSGASTTASAGFFARGEAARRQGDTEVAMSDLERAVALLEQHGSPTHPELAWPLVALAEVDLARGDLGGATSRLARVSALRRPETTPSPLQRRIDALRDALEPRSAN
jgi:tetratricopeptide (TPR) repeat protein